MKGRSLAKMTDVQCVQQHGGKKALLGILTVPKNSGQAHVTSALLAVRVNNCMHCNKSESEIKAMQTCVSKCTLPKHPHQSIGSSVPVPPQHHGHFLPHGCVFCNIH